MASKLERTLKIVFTYFYKTSIFLCKTPFTIVSEVSGLTLKLRLTNTRVKNIKQYNIGNIQGSE